MMLSESVDFKYQIYKSGVLILVLVDDALWALIKGAIDGLDASLNPCFSGWCSLRSAVVHYYYFIA